MGGRCGVVGGEGARTPERSTVGPPPPRPFPLSAPHLPQPQPCAGPALISPSPSPALPLGSDLGPLPRLPPVPPLAAPPPVLPLAQSGFGAPGPGLHAENWAARAGAEARGCSFTRSLKYFGKPQSGVGAKMALGLLWGAWGKGLRTLAKRTESDCSQISKVCPP